ncbi:class I SAM-dependent methyltransferase [Nitrospira sp. Nam74]
MIHYYLKTDQHSSHQQIANIVRELAREPILDVGSAQGMLGQLVKVNGLKIDAVEPNETWADAARPFYDNVYTGTIESVCLPANTYRLVVCADVLEHTVNPVEVLGRLRGAATNDAIFIISLPNVAYIVVRLMLLFGLFPKMERGPLDKTHLHFFTLTTAMDMLNQARLKVQRVAATGVPLEQLHLSGLFLRFGHGLQWAMVRLLPRLFAFQWIFVAKLTLADRPGSQAPNQSK